MSSRFLGLMALLVCLLVLAPPPAQAQTCETNAACAPKSVADLSYNQSQEDRFGGLFSGTVKSTVAWLSAALFLGLGLANVLYLITRKRVTGFPGLRRKRKEAA